MSIIGTEIFMEQLCFSSDGTTSSTPTPSADEEAIQRQIEIANYTPDSTWITVDKEGHEIHPWSDEESE